MTRLAAVLLLGVVVAMPLEAQRRGNSVLSGIVLTDVGGIPVVGAEVAIPREQLSVITDSVGAFRLTRIPAGVHEVIVRRLGYTLMTHSVTFSGEDEARRNFFLNRPQTLDTVTVEARSTISSFEENRKLGLGKFLTRAELAKLENVAFYNVIRQMNGVAITPSGATNAQWVTSARPRPGAGREPSEVDSLMRSARTKCYSNVYVDRMLMYSGKHKEPLFDLTMIPTSQIEAVEWYSGAASLPMEYNRGDVRCGVLVIHTRKFEPKKAK